MAAWKDSLEICIEDVWVVTASGAVGTAAASLVDVAEPLLGPIHQW